MGIITSETKQNITKNIATKEWEADSKVVEPSEHPIKDALLGKDPPMEIAHPGLGPALVFLAYPLTIIVMFTLICLYFLATEKDGQQAEIVTPATQSSSDESTKIQSP